MTFTGKDFLARIRQLDDPMRTRYAHHGTFTDGRWSLIEQIVDEAMARMAQRSEDGTDGE